jgi:P-type Cu2+ transporter
MTGSDPQATPKTDVHHPSPHHSAFRLGGVHCLCCAGAVERVLREQPHITEVQLDWRNDVVNVDYDPAKLGPEDIEQMIAQTGCDCSPAEVEEEHHHEAMAPPERRMQHLGHGVDAQPIAMGTKHDRMQYEMPATHADHGDHADHDMSDPNMAATMERDMRNRFFVALVLTIPTVLYSPLGMNLLGLRLPTFGLGENVIMLLLSTPVVFYCGWIFISGAYHSLRRRTLNMSVLIATGVLAAYLFSVLITFLGGETFYEAAAMLVTFVLFGHWMEMRSRRGTNDALRALFDLVPPQATVIRDGEEVTIPSSEIRLGDTVVLRPGDKVPVDGEVIEGETSIDEALVTGESVPVTKRPGDAVIAGSINRSGSVRFRATAVGADTTLAQIVELVQQAQNSKAPGQRLADRAAEYLVILAVGSGIVTFLVWYFLGGAAAITAMTFAISAVVIACPDALGLATPTAVAVGTGIGARHNILIKDAATLENVSRIESVVLDKTGTLTEGEPSLADVFALDGRSEDQVLRLVAPAEKNSEHPLAEAVVAGARDRGIERVFSEVLPADKARYVEQLQEDGKRVAMVGDGVNDAPALAQAEIGIAIGAGTDVAIETAKVVLMKSDPLDVTRAVVLSKATVRKMKQNLVWASVYNVLAIPIAAGVLYPAYGIMLRPEWSALLMSLSSIIVAVNAVLLKGVEEDLDRPRSDAPRSEPTPGA